MSTGTAPVRASNGTIPGSRAAAPPPEPSATRLDVRIPFTRAQALAAGITRAQLRGGSYEVLVRGVYVAAGTRRTPLLLAQAAVTRAAPTTVVIARHTAARLWGDVVPHSPDVHIAIPAAHRATLEGVRASRHHTLPAHRRRHGLLVSTPEETFCQLAASLPLVDLVVLGDSLVAREVTTPAALAAAVAGIVGRGARQARAAAAYVRSGVDSPMESRLRLLLVLAGLPEPTVNHILRTENGDWQVRFDLAYPSIRLAVEYDGRQHAENDRQWARDIERRHLTDDEGWRVVVVLSTGVYAEPEHTVAQVTRLLRERGLTVTPNPRWQRHFPSRG